MKQVFPLFRLFALLGVFLAFQACGDKNQTTEDQLIDDYVEPVHSIDLNVAVKNGALVFESDEKFFEAMQILDTFNLSSRLAWEDAIGFRSLRTAFELGLIKYFNEETDGFDLPADMIDYVDGFPALKGIDGYPASVLNRDAIVYIGDQIGTVREEGSFWIENGTKAQLAQALIEKESRLEDGIYVRLNKYDGPAIAQQRTCTNGFPNTSYTDQEFISNGTGRGSSALQGMFTFQFITTYDSQRNRTTIECYARLTGTSYRRSRNRRNWNLHRDNHVFSWDFDVLRVNSSGTTPLSFSGFVTHYNNQFAVRTINIFQSLISGTVIDEAFTLVETYDVPTNGGGTFQSTHNISPMRIEYACD
ncbi:MAG: hypothetical protein AAFV95_01245 [Bacteroidota bacterium]